MAHYVYNLYNTQTGTYIERMTIKDAAKVVGLTEGYFSAWASQMCMQLNTYEFDMRPFSGNWLVERRVGRSLKKHFNENDVEQFEVAWNEAVLPFRMLRERRDRRRQAHG